MLAVLLLNRMALKKRIARKQRVSKPVKVEIKAPEVFVCRTCLSTDDLKFIFSNKDSEKKRSHDLKLVTGLEIKIDDGLSQKICSKCIKIMKMSLKFRRVSRKAEKTLLSTVNDKKSTKKYKLRKSVLETAQKDVKKQNYDEQNVGDDFHNYEYITGADDWQDGAYQDHLYPNENDNNAALKKKESQPKVKKKATSRKKQDPIPNATLYKCSTCNKEFRMKATYKAHMRFHTNYCVCEACGKRCRNNNQLQEHKRARHGLGRIHSCAYCQYSAATKEALTIHERRHTGERPYACDHCGAAFHRRSNLVQHIAIHLPDKNFQCNLCHQREKSKKRLQVHQHKAHRAKRYRYECPECGAAFARPGTVRRHLARAHGLRRPAQAPAIARFEVQVDTSILPEIMRKNKMCNFTST